MSAQQQSGAHGTQNSGSSGPYPWKAGGVAGIVAYLVGYLATFAVIYADLQGSDTIDGFGWEDAGMIFYNAQFVGLEYGGEPNTINLLGSLGVVDTGSPAETISPVIIDSGILTVPALAYTGLIALVIAGSGYVVAKRAIPDQTGVTASMEAGMTIVAGYLPLAFIGSVLFETEFTETLAPDVFASVFIAGILFPLVFGAIGGYFASR